MMKYIKYNCKDCDKYLGYKINNGKYKRCRNCRTAFISLNPKEHTSYGRIHKNKKATFDVLNYTVDELKQHLESLFKPGMTWENYGQNGWEIDHVTPDSLFKYNSFEDNEFKKILGIGKLATNVGL